MGDLLRTLRLRAGLTISAAAERAGCHRVSWSLWENGHEQPSPEMLARAAEAVGACDSEKTELARQRVFGTVPSSDSLGSALDVDASTPDGAAEATSPDELRL